MAAPPVVQGKVIGTGQPASQLPPISAAAAAAGASSRCQQPTSDLEVLQMTCRDVHLPPEIRLGFVKKVYGILGVMLMITFGLTLPFILATETTLGFLRAHVWILYIVMGIVLAQFVFDMAMSCQMCCGSTGLLQSYLKMWKTSPWNYTYLMTFSMCFGVMVGFLCTQYTAQSVLLVFALTAVLVIALTIYAVKTQADFTGCGAYVMVLLLGLLMLLLVYSFFPGSNVMSKIIAGVGATIFGFIIVYDTQQIFGSASAAFGGGKRDIEYSLDMYAFAAWNLYLDFINFFVYMLQLLGDRSR